MHPSQPFRDRLLEQLRDEGLEVRRIVAWLPPLELTTLGECLYVDYEGRAGTAYHDGTRIVMLAAGFGPF